MKIQHYQPQILKNAAIHKKVRILYKQNLPLLQIPTHPKLNFSITTRIIIQKTQTIQRVTKINHPTFLNKELGGNVNKKINIFILKITDKRKNNSSKFCKKKTFS